MRYPRDEHGQASPEWLGLVLLVTLLAGAVLAAGLPVPGADLGRAIAGRIACAVGLGPDCDGERGDLTLAYGPELAALVGEHAPRLEYEEGMRALPVDFRSCRQDACAEGAGQGLVTWSLAGEPVTAFAHVVDCRGERAATREGYDCSGERAGRVYLQYWLYYPGSQTSRALYGDKGFHPDDWESFQVRIDPDGSVDARASSHHGYNGTGGDPINDTGWVGLKAAWTDTTGRYSISGGSHAGRLGRGASRVPVRGLRAPQSHRWTPGGAVRLIPIESLSDEWEDHAFEVTPPWQKPVFHDPEDRGT